MTMGERIKQLRRKQGMTQVELAAELGVTKGTVSTWETNSRTPGIDTLREMSDLFGCSVDYILGESDDPASDIDEKEIDVLAGYIHDTILTGYASSYARLDSYGRAAVQAVINAEFIRCREQNTLQPENKFSAEIYIK